MKIAIKILKTEKRILKKYLTQLYEGKIIVDNPVIVKCKSEMIINHLKTAIKILESYHKK